MVVITKGGFGQHTICLCPTKPHDAGYNDCLTISFITDGQLSMILHVPGPPVRAALQASPTSRCARDGLQPMINSRTHILDHSAGLVDFERIIFLFVY